MPYFSVTTRNGRVKTFGNFTCHLAAPSVRRLHGRGREEFGPSPSPRRRQQKGYDPIMSRVLLRFVSRLLLASMLFMQLAVAAYACPQDVLDRSRPAMAAMADMQDCAQMSQYDKAAPGLCAEHCHPAQQLTPHADAPSVPMALPGGFFVPLPASESLALPLARYADVLTLASSPPHTLLHCCFRI
ncbi:MAG: hypothetical protein JWL63_2384 [Rhodocyclales bacterium]|nr:hypothetical protein [Rhodocyclales bacterium]